ncbi:alpha/beta hydrolase [Mycobacterium heckeshornense]|uniref:Epoxide hydrolase n=1 Tax=Mycobacterium heckeshornense TaxID=110505 RepID=A0A2G8B9A5_9MYCO|nr:alpha/beta fold hydrolase [Mycobacterium heckeshornense]KMV21471.1 epoxide hydrolase [Mycobacterium heckeshornense]MCV7034093.1 alpha/beta fold hydrolase [Mycobacterium heckeshornense]PIJ34327.1 alpha/beta hydrolase [Mycobacterium heckeshornense]BCO34764.1 epoxide hydrolase [Mycobacterium heckeshornense]BCQ07937.1 epoxide hydrolase [Mycobacterium heckeshornense]
MTEPGWINVQAPEVELKALTWGPVDGPIALCLHGFPDTAYGWRKLAPRLAEAGWRVVAPFMRGYAPSSIPTDGSYHVGALMDDALQVRSAVGGTTRDVVIGHDWGAIAATGLAAMPDSPFAKAVIMSVPPAAAFRPLSRVPDVGRLLAKLPRQITRSWYILYFQLPWLPERSASWVVPRLWRQWSPTYDAEEDLRHVDAAIGTPESWRAALGPYRATIRNARPPARYAALHRYWTAAPVLPSLYLHGRDDGCATADFAHWAAQVLPDGSDVAIVDHAGHFLQLDQPETVAELVLTFIGSAR